MLGKAGMVRPMRYPVLGRAMAAEEPHSKAEAPALERVLAEKDAQHARELEAARREAFEKGRAAAAAELDAGRRARLAELAAAVEEFGRKRDEYLAQVETEVVRLALAIAERIVHREAQMDPLLLSGAVRVALGQLADSTQVRLRVPAEHAGLWMEMLRLMPRLTPVPEVVADAEMQGQEAVLESEVGSVHLGVRAQIAEIERGFFDLLEVRKQSGGPDNGRPDGGRQP